jgi:hypothetical protein
MKGSCCLWCIFEKSVGRDKVIQHSKPEPDKSSKVDIGTLLARRFNEIHDGNEMSLDCYSSADIEPVTTIMYQRRVFPMILSGNFPVVRTENGKLVHGILLPKLESEPGKEICHLNGWYRHKLSKRRPNDPRSEVSYHINICWPQNTLFDRFTLQVHEDINVEVNT